MRYGHVSGSERRDSRPHALGWLVATMCWVAAPAFGQPETLAAAPAPTAEIDDVAASEAFLASTIADAGRNSLRTAEAYVGLANAQRADKDFDAAAANYLSAVEVYRAIDGSFTPLAIPPLTDLGDNYSEAGDHANAISAYSEARTVSRRAFGLHNEGQIELLDRLSRSLLEMNQVAEADAQQVEALRLVQRSHAPDSNEVLNGIYKYAQWLGERSMFQLERDQYSRALRIVRQSYGDRDVRQVEALLGIGNTYREERNPASMGYAALQDALAILLEQPTQDSLAMATALRDLGDWSVAFSKTGYDGKEYLRAYELLGGVHGGEQLRRDWFTGAHYVLYEPISPRGLSSDPDARDGRVVARFDLDTEGGTSDVTIVESEPVGFKDEAVARHIRRSRFRPLIVDGRLARGEDLAIQFKFRYLLDAVATNDSKDGG